MNIVPRKYWNSIFDDFFTENQLFDLKCDVYEKDNIYYIEADVPGLDKKDINIEFADGYLTISAIKENNQDEEGKSYYKKERFYGKVERKFYIGEADSEAIDASFDNGILKITVPKKEKIKNIIEIK